MTETVTAKARVTRRAFVTRGKKADGFYHRNPLWTRVLLIDSFDRYEIGTVTATVGRDQPRL